jgi:predicted PolB exonuclease-like 3'-5' exonuclease
MLENINLEKILFLDIETVPQKASVDDLNETEKELWKHKAKYLKREVYESETDLYPRAGIYAEFGKIVCISVGYFISKANVKTFMVKSFAGHDEADILNRFSELLNNQFNKSNNVLCAHNGKEFDFPYLCRRMLINKISLPKLLDIAGKKPWEIQHMDTMELWRFGDYKSFTPLTLLAHVFKVPSPKEDMDGSMVWKVYWQDGNLERIAVYCMRDVVTIARILLAMTGNDFLEDANIVYVD